MGLNYENEYFPSKNKFKKSRKSLTYLPETKMKRFSSRNTISDFIASNQIERTTSAFKVQVEPNPENDEKEEFPGGLDSTVLQLNETFSKSCESSDVLETISTPKIYGEIRLELNLGDHSHTKALEVAVSKPILSSKAEDSPDSFFKAMRPVVILAQCFGLFPVIGITGPNHRSLKFKWLQWRMLYGLFALGGLLLPFMCSFLESVKIYFSSNINHWLIFSASQITVAFFFVQIARKWPKINEEFAELESNFNKYGDLPKTNIKIKLIAITLMTLSGVHYLIRNRVTSIWIEACYELDGLGSMFETFMTNIYHLVFSRIPYSHWTGGLIVYLDILLYFIWTFRDLFLASISINLSSRLKQLNGVMFQIRGQEMPSSFWRTIREDYNQLSILVTDVDTDVQILMLMSIVDNLYHICLNAMIKIKTVSSNIYDLADMILILGLLIIRAFLVLFPAASIHYESNKAKKVLYSVPQTGYCSETKRFLTQLTTDEIALTGWGFFSVTRGLIITIVGTLITYEITFVQFGNNLGFEDGAVVLLQLNKSDCAAFKSNTSF